MGKPGQLENPYSRTEDIAAIDFVIGPAIDIMQLKISSSDAIVPLRFGAGEDIIRQGETGSRFYSINDGEVEVVR